MLALDAAVLGVLVAIGGPGAESVFDRPLWEVSPYRIEPARFSNGHVRLAGTLYLPHRVAHVPAIILTQGSGWGGRTGQYRSLAEFFARNGIAALIYDKRGTGQSSGTYQETPDEIGMLAGDVLAGVRRLREHPRINPQQVGIWGHSQGGTVALCAADLSDDVAFVINVSSPGVPPFEQMLYQKARRLTRSGYPQEDGEAMARLLRVTWTYWGTGEGFEETRALYEAAVDEPWFETLGWPETLQTVDEMEEQGLLSEFRKPYLHYDPLPVLERIGIPTLNVYGELDWKIPLRESVELIEAAIARNQANRDMIVKVFAEADHGIMFKAEDRRLFFAPGYPEYLLAWIESRIASANEISAMPEEEEGD